MQSALSRHLQTELLARCKKNPKYSLRAFAKSLSISPATLSKAMRGKQELGEATQARILKKMNVSALEAEQLGSDRIREVVHEKLQRYGEWTQEMIAVLSEWHHGAILELTTIEGFRPQTRWIAKKLDLPTATVEQAVQRMLQCGCLEIGADGRWVDRMGSITTAGFKGTSEMHRSLQKSILLMAIRALESTPVERRCQTSVTFSADPARLPEAIEYIRIFKKKLASVMRPKSGPSKEVFQLTVGIFPLSRESVK